MRGFTLIELLMSIAILGILMTVAVPAYMDYAIRARVSEGLNMLAWINPYVTEYRQTQKRFPTSLQEIGHPEYRSKYVSSIELSGNPDSETLVTVDIDEEAVGAPGCTIELVLRAYDSEGGGAIEWECRKGATTANCLRYLPASCRK